MLASDSSCTILLLPILLTLLINILISIDSLKKERFGTALLTGLIAINMFAVACYLIYNN